jgi:hypothetical protein
MDILYALLCPLQILLHVFRGSHAFGKTSLRTHQSALSKSLQFEKLPVLSIEFAGSANLSVWSRCSTRTLEFCLVRSGLTFALASPNYGLVAADRMSHLDGCPCSPGDPHWWRRWWIHTRLHCRHSCWMRLMVRMTQHQKWLHCPEPQVAMLIRVRSCVEAGSSSLASVAPE